MNFTHTVLYLTFYALYLLLPSNVPGQGLLDSIAAFITGPFGKAITLIAIVLCGVSYMYGKQSDNSSIGRVAIRVPSETVLHRTHGWHPCPPHPLPPLPFWT